MTECDFIISGATIVTMNQERLMIKDGAIAVSGDAIVAIGKNSEITPKYKAKRTINGSGFLITPGFTNAHNHITCDPLTHSFVRGGRDVSPFDRLWKWVTPLFKTQTPEDEAIAAQLATVYMLKAGTTMFLEAGTVLYLDEVMEALKVTGIRGRVGQWVEGRAYDPDQDQAKLSREAIKIIEDEVKKYPDKGPETLLAAWPILVGHSTNSDDVWLAAKEIAKHENIKVSAHMSPRDSDTKWFLKNYGRHPIEHLHDIGALGENVCLTHLAVFSEGELECMVESKTTAIHCPYASYQGGQGVSQFGKYPEMLERGVDIMLGTDGKFVDILSSARLMASMFRDVRNDSYIIDDAKVLELATLAGARGVGFEKFTGSLEVGKKADFVLHDITGPECDYLFDPLTYLALDAQAYSIDSVFINGVQVLEGGKCTLFDEEKVIADARQAGKALIKRANLPTVSVWPII